MLDKTDLLHLHFLALMTFEFGLMCEMEELLKLVIITVVKMLFIQIQTMVGWIQHFTSY